MRHGFVSAMLTRLIIFCYSRKKTLWHKTVDNGQDSMGIALQCLHQDSLRLPELTLELNHRRHFEYSRTSSNGFFSCRITRYPNSVSTFHLSRLFISWDVDLNPGPNNEKPKCHKCSRSMARNHQVWRGRGKTIQANSDIRPIDLDLSIMPTTSYTGMGHELHAITITPLCFYFKCFIPNYGGFYGYSNNS